MQSRLLISCIVLLIVSCNEQPSGLPGQEATSSVNTADSAGREFDPLEAKKVLCSGSWIRCAVAPVYLSDVIRYHKFEEKVSRIQPFWSKVLELKFTFYNNNKYSKVVYKERLNHNLLLDGQHSKIIKEIKNSSGSFEITDKAGILLLDKSNKPFDFLRIVSITNDTLVLIDSVRFPPDQILIHEYYCHPAPNKVQ